VETIDYTKGEAEKKLSFYRAGFKEPTVLPPPDGKLNFAIVVLILAVITGPIILPLVSQSLSQEQDQEQQEEALRRQRLSYEALSRATSLWNSLDTEASEESRAASVREGLQRAKEAVKLSPDDSKAQLLLAQFLCQSGEYDEAVAVYERYHKLGGHDPAPAYQLLEAGQDEKALRIFDLVLTGRRPCGPAIDRSLLLFKMGREDLAVQGFSKLGSCYTNKKYKRLKSLVEAYYRKRMSD